jgi:hypothetical protein
MTESPLIAQIAGRDSVAAAVAAVRDRGFTSVLPTIAFTGTETGDFEAPRRAVETLRLLLTDEAPVLEPITVSNPELWRAMNACCEMAIQQRYGVSSPCLACHLYLHLLRVPISWDHDDAPVCSGERETHDGRIKLSQTSASIDAATRVLAYAGVELLEPVRAMSGDDVAVLAGDGWAQGARQLRCEYSGNYVGPDGTVRYEEDGYARYLAEFFEPVGLAVVDAWRAERAGGPATDWQALVREVLSRA